MIEHHAYECADVFVYQRAKADGPYCGDSYFFIETPDYFFCMLADGLGSGLEAKKAADQAVSAVRYRHRQDLASLMDDCNRALRRQRGAVLSMFKIDFHHSRLAFCGVGNIRFMFDSPEGKMEYPLPSVGFMSGRAQSYRVQDFPYMAGSTFLLYSDGMEVNADLRRALFVVAAQGGDASEVEQLLCRQDVNHKDDRTLILGKCRGKVE